MSKARGWTEQTTSRYAGGTGPTTSQEHDDGAPEHVDTSAVRRALERRLEQPIRLWPPLLVAGSAGALALLAPFVVVPLVLTSAAFTIGMVGGRQRLLSIAWLSLSVVAATLLLQPLILHASGIEWRAAVYVSLLLAGRLAAMLVVAGALHAWVAPADWLEGLRRWPHVAFVAMLTLRLVPEFAAMHRRVRRAQQARGLTSWRHRMRGIVTSFVLVLEKADRMARGA